MGDRETGCQVYGAGEKDQSVSNGGLGDLGCRDLGKGLSEGEADRGQRFPPETPVHHSNPLPPTEAPCQLSLS